MKAIWLPAGGTTFDIVTLMYCEGIECLTDLEWWGGIFRYVSLFIFAGLSFKGLEYLGKKGRIFSIFIKENGEGNFLNFLVSLIISLSLVILFIP